MKNIRYVIQLLLFCIIIGTYCLSQDINIPKIYENTLPNGLQVLLVEKPNNNLVHTQIFIKSGRVQIGCLPPLTTDLLMRTVFKRMIPIHISKKLYPNLEQEIKEYETSLVQKIICNKEEILATITKKLDDLEKYDDLDILGVTKRDLLINSDYCSYSMNVPSTNILSWCQTIANNLKDLNLIFFPKEHNQLITEISDGLYYDLHSLTDLINLHNDIYHPIANVSTLKQIKSVSIESLTDYAKFTLSPENIIIVMVGDIKTNISIPQLENTFSKIKKYTNNKKQLKCISGNEFDANTNIETKQSFIGNRLVIKSVKKDDDQILLCWPLPTIDQKNILLIKMLVKILNNHCKNNLINKQHICRYLIVDFEILKQQSKNLLIIKAKPELSYPISEIERELQNEIINLRHSLLPERELQKVQMEIENDEFLMQNTPNLLAYAIGQSQCQINNWKTAFCASEANQYITSLQLQRLVYNYLTPDNMSVVIVNSYELQPLENWAEKRLLQILTPILERKLNNDATKLQTILKEIIRQLHMMPSLEFSKIIELLEPNI